MFFSHPVLLLASALLIHARMMNWNTKNQHYLEKNILSCKNALYSGHRRKNEEIVLYPSPSRLLLRPPGAQPPLTILLAIRPPPNHHCVLTGSPFVLASRAAFLTQGQDCDWCGQMRRTQHTSEPHKLGRWWVDAPRSCLDWGILRALNELGKLTNGDTPDKLVSDSCTSFFLPYFTG